MITAGSASVNLLPLFDNLLHYICDLVLLLWDLRYKNQIRRTGSLKGLKSGGEAEPVQWNPLHVFPLSRLDGVGTIPISKFSVGKCNKILSCSASLLVVKQVSC